MGKPRFFEEATQLFCRVRSRQHGHIKHILFTGDFECDKRKLYAVVSEAIKAKRLLKLLLKRSGLYALRRGACAGDGCGNCRNLIDAFELLLGQGEVENAGGAVLRHFDVLQEVAEAEMRHRGLQSLQEAMEGAEEVQLPIYVRVNTLLATVKEVLKHFRDRGFDLVKMPEGAPYDAFLHNVRQLKDGQYMRDHHIKDLFVFPPNTDFHLDPFFTERKFVVQDKASCIPAAILAPPAGSVVLDACAAPGNKCSQLAALMNNKGRLVAIDRDGERFQTMCDLLETSGVTCTHALQHDFLRLRSDNPKNQDIEFILLDPSCSGSGIVRDLLRAAERHAPPDERRLRSLGNFQATLLRHALSFPSVRRVVYSTCSLHELENEAVVQENAERYKDSFQLVNLWPDWPRRGRQGLDTCLRTEPSLDLTNGFFVACFERR